MSLFLGIVAALAEANVPPPGYCERERPLKVLVEGVVVEFYPPGEPRGVRCVTLTEADHAPFARLARALRDLLPAAFQGRPRRHVQRGSGDGYGVPGLAWPSLYEVVTRYPGDDATHDVMVSFVPRPSAAGVDAAHGCRWMAQLPGLTAFDCSRANDRARRVFVVGERVVGKPRSWDQVRPEELSPGPAADVRSLVVWVVGPTEQQVDAITSELGLEELRGIVSRF